MRRLIVFGVLLTLIVFSQIACSSAKKSNTVTFAYGSGSTELTISDDVVRAMLEDALDSELGCDGDLDPSLRKVFEQLERQPRGHASTRDGSSTLYAKRRGGKLEMRIDDSDGGRIDATMPWAVAECLLGRSTTLDEALGSGRVPIEIKFTGSDGTRIAAKLGS